MTRVGEVANLLDAPLRWGRLAQAYEGLYHSFGPPLQEAELQALRLTRGVLVLKVFVGKGGALSSESHALRAVSIDDALCQAFERPMTEQELSHLHLSLSSMRRLCRDWEGPQGFNVWAENSYGSHLSPQQVQDLFTAYSQLAQLPEEKKKKKVKKPVRG